MSVATYKVTIRTDQVNEEGRAAVRIRITKNRAAKYYNTGIYLKLHKDPRKSEWNPKAEREKKNWVTSRHFDHAASNTRIDVTLKGLQGVELANPHYTSQQIRDAYGQPETGLQRGFIAFAEEWIRRKQQHGQYSTAGSYVTKLVYFNRFWGKRPDDPHLITPSVISDFIHYLRTCDTHKGFGKGLAAITINGAFAVYRNFWKQAILEGWVPPGRNPFDVPALETTLKPIERPTVEQILSLMEVHELTPTEKNARNTFLLQFFLNGARVSEAYTLKWSDISDTHISYKPRKRANQVKMVPRHTGLEWVLQQYPRTGPYVLPYITPDVAQLKGTALVKAYTNINTKIDNALKRVFRRCGLPVLSSHSQRHTFADYVWEQTGDLKIVQEMLGHSASKTTEGYMSRIGQLRKDDLNRSLFAQVNNPDSKGNSRETEVSGDVQSERTIKSSKQL